MFAVIVVLFAPTLFVVAAAIDAKAEAGVFARALLRETFPSPSARLLRKAEVDSITALIRGDSASLELAASLLAQCPQCEGDPMVSQLRTLLDRAAFWLPVRDGAVLYRMSYDSRR